MPTIGSRRCGIRATASHCLGVAPARIAIDRAPPAPSHDGDALRACSPSCWPYKSSQLFDCDEQGAGPALPPVSCLSSALTAATGKPGGLANKAMEVTDSSAQHNFTARTWSVPVDAGGSLGDLC